MLKENNLPAIKGGTPVRPPEKKIYYGRQWIDEDDIKAVADTLRSDFITCGPAVEALERKLEAYTGAKHAVAVSNGTAALHAACAAAGIGPGDEVITTPLTFMASANCALYVGAKPVFADVDPETMNIDPASVAERITERTKAVVAVDYTGQVADIDALRALCDKHHLLLIEDAAHSIGSKYNGKPVGSLADFTCFSFHPVKTVTSGEGGAVLTDDDAWARRLRLFRSHAMEHDPEKMTAGPHEGSWVYEQQFLGYNYRMTDFQAALLTSQLGKIDCFIARRKEIVKRYDEAFRDLPGLLRGKEIPQSDTARHLYVIRLDLQRLSCTRAEFFNAMGAENVQCQVHYVPVYRFPYYQLLGYAQDACPHAEAVYAGIMSIPLYPALTDADVEDVIRAVTKLVKYYTIG